VFGCQLRPKLIVKAQGLGDTRRISETTRESIESYERRMRIFNLAIIVVALMILTILIIWLSDTWMAFEKSLANTF
jgi:phage baseplate assembly protein W